MIDGGLNYNDGPYVITTRVRPDRVTRSDEKVVIKLVGISPARITPVLNVLEADLRRQRELRQGRLVYEEVKQALLTAFERNQGVLVKIGVSVLK